MDVQCAALGAAGLAAYMQLRQRSLAWALLAANALLAASGFTHPNGDLYFVALVCLVLMYDRDRLQWRFLFISGIPYLIGALMWAPYILKAPDLFKIQLLGNMVGRESAFSAPVSTLQREVKPLPRRLRVCLMVQRLRASQRPGIAGVPRRNSRVCGIWPIAAAECFSPGGHYHRRRVPLPVAV